MIYEAVTPDAPIRQGDIFQNIPRVDFSLSQLAVMESDGGLSESSWRDYLEEPEGEPALRAVLPIKPVDAIVVTQDCDCVRSNFLSLCQIDSYKDATGKSPTTPKAWQKQIIGEMTKQPKLFYLPVDESLGRRERCVVDFRIVLPVKRTDLEGMRDARAARLNPVAYEHFRESLAQFFRRYPVNGWYPLTREELETYADSVVAPPYPWQRDGTVP